MARRPGREPLPAFASEREERQFWETHDTTPFVDWSRARIAVFPNLKPSTETISLRLPMALLSELKALANRRDVPYQSLLKVFLAERLARETAGMATVPGETLERRGRARRSGVKGRPPVRATRR
jgi:predicted DNA binding CopG/RHH family protein